MQVGKVSWGLQTSMPTLRANAHTFMFAIPGTQTFYSVLIAESKQSELSNQKFLTPEMATESTFAFV